MTSRAKFTSIKSLLAAATVVFLLASANPGRAADEPAADDTDLAKTILQKADLVRFPAQGFEVGVTINSSGAAAPTEVHKYRILSKGNENTIVMSTEPASERGQIMLMKARDLWVFLPAVSQPVRLGLSQRLTGMVANGDLARANFVGDYEPKLLRKESVEGEPTYVLELMAVDRGVPYHRVVLWVHQSHLWPGEGRVLLAVGPAAEDVLLPEV